MQIKVFCVPMEGGEQEEAALNKFLRGNRILKVQQQFTDAGSQPSWSYSVSYLQGGKGSSRKKVDYEKVLSAAAFKRFEQYRRIRLKLSKEDRVAPFILFTDKQLAALANLEKLDLKSMQSIKGVGAAKAEKYGERFLKALKDEA